MTDGTPTLVEQLATWVRAFDPTAVQLYNLKAPAPVS